MRPQTQALISKLRTMKTLAEPGTAEEVIWDIAWTQLYKKHQEVRLGSIAARLVHAWVSLRGNEDVLGTPVPPEPEEAKPAPAPQLDLEDKELKRTINLTIGEHMPQPKSWGFTCSCGREYAAAEEWGNHIRIQVWRRLKNNFPPIGTEEK